MFYFLNQKGRISESVSKFYICELIIALNSIHRRNIIYRDLKPENVLIGVDGHIKISDFGLAKIQKDLNDLNFTFCGSPEYLSPEMLLGTPHNYTVDYYTLGCFIYEIITGYPPFYSRDK